MSKRIFFKPGGLLGICLTALVFAAIPAGAQASAVNLESAGSFVALGATTVTNTGPSVLNGDLGVAPGTSLTGFGSPAVVNGATHDNDAVAAQAQSDLTAAYNVAAGQPVEPADDLTGTDLGGLTLTAGAYRYTSSAQLTGVLTLDAQGDPNAQFVFEIGSTLTTASASSVVLINGASPCNVYWQVGSSATLDTTTAFQGNVMALTDISLNSGASVIGRVLARNGQISLIDNVLDGSRCGTGSTAGPISSNPSASAPTSPGSAQSGKGSTPSPPNPKNHKSTHRGTAVLRPGSRSACSEGFRATVRGRMIERVIFSLDGKRIASRTNSPFRVLIEASPGAHALRAQVTFKDATRARTMRLRYRGCAEAVLRPHRGPSQFTG
jgi:ice-binding like protein